MSGRGFPNAEREALPPSFNAAEDREFLKQILALLQDDHDKFGSHARLASCVASVLADAVNLAESRDHSTLSRALAPAVADTVRTEIRNARDELVHALYPLAG